jgi:hypothetical protein
MTQLKLYCDPDAPLPASEWGLLKRESEDISHERLYSQYDASLIVNDGGDDDMDED